MASDSAFITWLTTVGISVGVTIVTYWGLCGAVHYHYYVRRRDEAEDWKIQPNRFLSDAKNRSAFIMGSGNIMLGALVGGSFAAYVSLGGWSSLYLDINAMPLWWIPVSAVLLHVMFDAGLYYAHRLLHQKWFFRRVHRHHHKFRAPTIFTMTAVHPAEFLFLQAVLIACAFILPVHWGVYVAVVLYTYLIGAIDHVGAKVDWPLPFHTSNRFHDDHHVYFHCNYGHHTALWDRLHRTDRQVDRHYDENTFGRGAAKPSDAASPSNRATVPETEAAKHAA